jgi:hypothetical protein
MNATVIHAVRMTGQPSLVVILSLETTTVLPCDVTRHGREKSNKTPLNANKNGNSHTGARSEMSSQEETVLGKCRSN